MKRNKQSSNSSETGKHEHPLPQEISQSEKQNASNALEQAEEDMNNDVEFSAHSPNDGFAAWACVRKQSRP